MTKADSYFDESVCYFNDNYYLNTNLSTDSKRSTSQLINFVHPNPDLWSEDEDQECLEKAGSKFGWALSRICTAETKMRIVFHPKVAIKLKSIK